MSYSLTFPIMSLTGLRFEPFVRHDSVRDTRSYRELEALESRADIFALIIDEHAVPDDRFKALESLTQSGDAETLCFLAEFFDETTLYGKPPLRVIHG